MKELNSIICCIDDDVIKQKYITAPNSNTLFISRSYLEERREDRMMLVNVFVMFMLVIGVMVVVPTVSATSVKMDFLPYADVRVDPIVDPECLADHGMSVCVRTERETRYSIEVERLH